MTEGGPQQLVYLRSTDREPFSNAAQANFDLNPPVATANGGWKPLSFSMIAAIGPPNNVTVDVEVDIKIPAARNIKGDGETDSWLLESTARTYAGTFYPANESCVQTSSLYDDYCGLRVRGSAVFGENSLWVWRDGNGSTSYNNGFLHVNESTKTIALGDLNLQANPTETSAYWLWTQYTPPGYSETHDGNSAPAATTQLAMLIQQCIRRQICKAYNDAVDKFNYEPAAPASPRYTRKNYDANAGTLQLIWDVANVFPQNYWGDPSDPDDILFRDQTDNPRFPGTDTVRNDGQFYNVPFVAETGVNWVMDVGNLFRMVPPGAKVAHTSATGTPFMEVQDDGTHIQRNFVGPTFEFVNQTNKWAFLYFYDMMHMMKFNAAGERLGSAGLLVPPLGTSYPARQHYSYSAQFQERYLPWVTGVRFRINNVAVASAFGMRAGEWQSAGCPSTAPGTKQGTSVEPSGGDGAQFYYDAAAAYQLNYNPRYFYSYYAPWNPTTRYPYWISTSTGNNPTLYEPARPVYPRWPDEDMWPAYELDGLSYDEARIWRLPPTVAQYSPDARVPAPPTIYAEISLLNDHQTRHATNRPSTVGMAIPIPGSATDTIQYTNTTIDWANARGQERISQFSVTLTSVDGKPLNNPNTLPPPSPWGTSAYFPDTPDWTMELAFD